MFNLVSEPCRKYTIKEGEEKKYNTPKFSHFDFIVVDDLDGMENAQKILLEANESRNINNIDFPPSSMLFEKNCVTFLITEDHKLVGTFSLIIDSMNGLPADKTFSNELTQYRNTYSTRISEICSLGVTKNCKRKKEIIFYIVMLATLQNIKLNILECFITVKDKHVSFYKALQFEESSVKKISQRTFARVQLLSIKRESIILPSILPSNQNQVQPDTIKNLWNLLLRNISEKSISSILSQLQAMEYVRKIV